ncbi:glycosyltransferase [Methylobacterium frigidaeris]|uniref:Glycosyltransferase 2-like domain-containing protein n=1 Tax=Methylobacterium frigidaeris TaxID=2038277 RepID=A0AA37HFJ2_9HYPH|nr:glycosyltransferase [Methylobacterium frigidaeris]GJD64275.1 hypothetical protein MPEAHAMD_4456 [Methylobacterium frigidaeris]
MDPKLAVIVPCFNNSDTIGEAIGSILSQEYDRFELHVCDNASDDGTRDIIAAITDPRLRPALHATRVARTDNWNRAYEAGFSAEYLVTLHADDRLAPGALRSIATAARSGPALIHGLFRHLTYEGGSIAGVRFPFRYHCTGDDFRELILLNNMVAVPGVTVRTDVFRDAGGWDPAWSFLQDLELWWRCSTYGEVIYLATHLGDQRMTKVPDPVPRHAAEHLRWTIEKLSTLESPRLRHAAIDGLADYVDRLSHELADRGDVPPQLRDSIRDARDSIARGPRPRPGARHRQRRLRLHLALRSWLRSTINPN